MPISDLPKFLSAVALLALSGPAWAQEEAPAPAGDTPPSADAAAPEADNRSAPVAGERSAPEGDAPAADQAPAPGGDAAGGAADAPEGGEPAGTDGLSMGQAEGQAEGEGEDGGPGSSYVAEEFGDWQQRCVRTEEGADPCQLYQLLRDKSGNAVAEMSVFPLPPGREAAAGATVITPLETLLTRNLRLSVDGGQVKRYPFDFCAQQGCFARIGLTASEVSQFKRGAEAQLTIVPAAAPDQEIDLAISLSGFTAGYDATVEANAR